MLRKGSIIFLLITAATPITGKAQGFAIFGDILKQIKGFNVLASKPVYISPNAIATKDSWHLAYSIKAGPIFLDDAPKEDLDARSSITFNLGYGYTFGTRYKLNGFEAQFPYGGTFLQAVTRHRVWDFGDRHDTTRLKLTGGVVLGFGASFHDLTKGSATYIDTAVRMTANLALSPELFIGIAQTIGDVSIFVDGGYQFLKWTNIQYETVHSSSNLNNFYDRLPDIIDLSAWQITLGMSFNLRK